MVKNNKIFVSLAAAALASCFLTGNKEVKAAEQKSDAAQKQTLVKEIAQTDQQVEKRQDLLQQKMRQTLLLTSKVTDQQEEADITPAQKQLAQLDEQIKDYEKKYKDEEDKQNNIEQEIQQAQKDKEQTKEELAQKQASLKDLKTETDKAREHLAQALKEAKEKAGSSEEKEENKDYEKLIANQQKLLAKLKSLADEAQKLKTELNDKEKAFLALTDPLTKAEKELKQVKEDLDVFTKYAKNDQNRLANCQSLSKSFKDKLAKAKAELEQLQKNHADDKAITAKEQEVSSLTKEYKDKQDAEAEAQANVEHSSKNLADRTEIYNQALQKRNGLLDQQRDLKDKQEQLQQAISQNKQEHEQTLEDLATEVQAMLDAQVNPPSAPAANLDAVQKAYDDYAQKMADQEELSQSILALQQSLTEKNEELSDLEKKASQSQQNKNDLLIKIQNFLKEKLALIKDMPAPSDKPTNGEDEQEKTDHDNQEKISENEQELKNKIQNLETEIAAIKKDLRQTKDELASLKTNEVGAQKREALYQDIIRQYQQLLQQKTKPAKTAAQNKPKKQQQKKTYLQVKIKGHWQKLSYKAAMAKLKANSRLTVSLKTTVKTKGAKLTYRNGHVSRKKLSKGKKITLREVRKTKGKIFFRLAKTRLWINAKDLQIS